MEVFGDFRTQKEQIVYPELQKYKVPLQPIYKCPTMSFLSELATLVIDPQIIDYKKIAVVLPNKRAQKALDVEMARIAGRNIFPPTVFSIDEFVGTLTGLKILSTSELLLELYGVYKTVADLHHTEPDDFQKFMSWATNLIRDFNDIDRQLADAGEIFSYLKDFKDIGIEIESGGQPTAGQVRYLEFYGILHDLYVQFGETLREKGEAYPGLVYRVAAENIQEISENLDFTKYYFAGLNAMTPTEARIISHLYQAGKVQFVFDFDNFYLEYTAQIRDELSKTFHIKEEEIHTIGDHFANDLKSIRTYGVSKTMNQIYQAVEILKRIEQDNPAALNRTAVVFADENLIVPFVHAYSPAKCNISKKYPARATSAYRLLQVILSMARNYQRFQKQGDTGTPEDESSAAYYHKDVMALYRNPLVAAAFMPDTAAHEQFIRSLVRKNQLFFSRNTLNERLPDSCPDVTGGGLALIKAAADYFRLVASLLPFHADASLLEQFAVAMDRAAELLSRFGDIPVKEVRIAEFFINEQIDQLDLSFKGDRTSGVQVMGLLETRTLDFDHVVMLSVNEGVIPSGNKDNSLILFEIKKRFHLSTYEQNDAIYGYHFFHALQRAKDIHLIYNADSTDAVAEESRFIKQIAFKKQKGHFDNIQFEKVVRPPLPMGTGSAEVEPLSVAVTDEIRKQLKTMEFSASSLSTYINCPLQFYLQYVVKILPEEDINENVDQNIIGLVIHKALEQLGNAVIGKSPEASAAQVDLWAEKIKEDYILDLFKQYDEVKGQDLQRGRLYLATEVVRKTLAAYLPLLRKELAAGSTSIIGCEQEFSCSLDVDGTPVHFTGFADRIDLHDKKTAILDYKSGKAHPTQFSNINELFSDTDKKHIFQLFCYMVLYKHRNLSEFPTERFPNAELESGIIYLRKVLKGEEAVAYAKYEPTEEDLQKFEKENQKPPTMAELTEKFESNLKLLIKNILEEEQFIQTDDTSHCTDCDYALICQQGMK